MTLRERRMLNEAVKQRIVEADGAVPTVDDLAARATAANHKYGKESNEENWKLANSTYKAWQDAVRTSAGTPAAAASAAPAAPAAAASAAPSDDSPIGSTLSKDGKVVFVLTEEGWKTTLRISEEQILALVIPAVQEELKKQMRAAKGQGDELHIVKSSLTKQGAANKSNELFLKRDGEEFADPVVIPVVKMQTIMNNQELAYENGSDQNMQDTPAAAAQHRLSHDFISIGAAIIRLQDSNGATELIVHKDKLSGFDDLFGTSNSGKIMSAIKKAADSKAAALQKDAGKQVKREYPESFKIPLSWAMDGSIMKYMSDSILRGVGIGKIEFKTYNTDSYRASIKLNPKEIAGLKAKLEARKTANA
jgi:hypothetical protein